MDSEHSVPIWFFVGIMLLLYGVVITGVGIYGCFVPPEHPVVLAELHADLWWGILMTVAGAVYTVRFLPKTAAK